MQAACRARGAGRMSDRVRVWCLRGAVHRGSAHSLGRGGGRRRVARARRRAGAARPVGARDGGAVPGADRADWHCYVARLDGVPAAVAALRVRDGIGSLTFDGTTPRFRGRGCQTALIRHRIADAAAAGCGLVVTQTDPDSSSQRNLERAGFRTAYTRTFWTSERPASRSSAGRPRRSVSGTPGVSRTPAHGLGNHCSIR